MPGIHKGANHAGDDVTQHASWNSNMQRYRAQIFERRYQQNATNSDTANEDANGKYYCY